MSFTILSKKIHTTDGYYVINIYQDKFESCFHVALYKAYEENGLYHDLSDLIYCDLKDAKRRFNYLRRKYEQDEIKES